MACVARDGFGKGARCPPVDGPPSTPRRRRPETPAPVGPGTRRLGAVQLRGDLSCSDGAQVRHSAAVVGRGVECCRL
jgi:hypothetical protein